LIVHAPRHGFACAQPSPAEGHQPHLHTADPRRNEVGESQRSSDVVDIDEDADVADLARRGDVAMAREQPGA